MILPENNWQRRTVWFFISQCITLFGSTLVQMAVVWYVTLKTSSGVWVAAFSVCSYLPQFMISFVGGVWADRYNRKWLIILSDGMTAAVTLLMFFLMPFLREDGWLFTALLVMSLFRSFGAGVQNPAVNAVIPQLVPKEHLLHYNGVNAAMQSVVQFAAPAAAGVVLSMGTLHQVLLIDVATAAIGIGLFWGVDVPGRVVRSERDIKGHEFQERKQSVLKDMKMGVRYAFSERFIGRLLMIYGLFVFLCVPAGFMAGLFVSRIYGDTYWYLTAAELVGFAGMTAGGLFMGAWGGLWKRERTLGTGLCGFGLMAAGMGVTRNFTAYLVMMGIYGIALTVVQTAVTTLVQERTKGEVQGRVFGLLSSVYSGALPLGMAVFGPMADVAPLSWIMAGAGAVLMVLGACWLLYDLQST